MIVQQARKYKKSPFQKMEKKLHEIKSFHFTSFLKKFLTVEGSAYFTYVPWVIIIIFRQSRSI